MQFLYQFVRFSLIFTIHCVFATDLRVETGQTMPVGGRRAVQVQAKEYWGKTSLYVKKGETYLFSVSPNDEWQDASIVTNADGFSVEDFKKFCGNINLFPCSLTHSASGLAIIEAWKRVPSSNFFTLIGNLNQNERSSFPIGTHLEKTFTEAGIFYVYANDWPAFYFNNSGSITLNIERLK